MSVKTTITGNLGKKITLSKVSLNNGKSEDVCNFSVASTPYKRTVDAAGHTSYEQKGETAWIDCTVWGARASGLAKLLQKGMPVILSGTEVLRKNEDSDGKVYVNRTLVVEQIGLNLFSNRVGAETTEDGSTIIKLRPASAGESPDTAAEEKDGDIPF